MSFDQRYRHLRVPEGNIEVEAAQAQRAVLALTELRVWAVASPSGECDWLLQRIDMALDVFGVTNDVRRAIGMVMEGMDNEREGTHDPHDPE